MRSVLQDLKFALRQLRRAPIFTLVAIVTLALGIGAITTVFTWGNAILFNPWPHVRSARDIRAVSATVHTGGGYSLNYAEYQYLATHWQSFSAMTAHEILPVDLAASGDRPQTLWAGIVSSNYFDVLGMQPELGRFFTVHDDRAYGSRPEVVLSDDLWHTNFRGDPAILGRTIRLNHHAFTVVGIAMPGFVGIYGGMAQSMWLAFSNLPVVGDAGTDPLGQGHFGMQVAARLRPGVREEQASAELHALARQFAAAQQGTKYRGWDLNLNDTAHLPRGLYSMVGEAMPLLVGAAVLLLVLVCANVAGLLIQRGMRQRREIAIRTSLGASRGRVVRHLLTETAVLAILGGVLGWLASLSLSRTLYLLLPQFGMPLDFNLHPDFRVFLFAMGVTCAVVVASGLLPARQAIRVSQVQALHDGAVSVLGASGGRKRTVLLSLQLGIGFIVLLCCGLLLRTLINVMQRDPGFDTHRTLVAALDLTRAGYTSPKGLQFESALLERLRAAPGVDDAALTTYVPMGNWGGGHTREVAIEGYVPAKDESLALVTDAIGPDYFRTLRIPLLQGREFTSQDDASAAPVLIVNEDMARQYWPKGNALGGRVQVGGVWCEVVGISRHNIYRYAADDGRDPVLYIPLLQHYNGEVNLVVRAKTSAYGILPDVQQAVASIDSTLPLGKIESLAEHVDASYFGQRIPVEMISAYAVCSLLVALLGVYAAMAYAVAERYKEFALRVALGAEKSHVFVQVLRSGMQVIVGGLLMGAVGAFFAVRMLKSALYGISPFDPISAIAALILLVVSALGATVWPARNATRVDPMRALRSE